MRDIFSSQINMMMLNTPTNAMLNLNNLFKDFKTSNDKEERSD